MWELFLAGMWTVFILHFPSNLLVLYDVDFWNSKEPPPISLSFYVVFLCVLILALLKATALYPFCLKVFLKCHISSIKHIVSYIVLVQLMSVVST
jgi:hypothetical protein